MIPIAGTFANSFTDMPSARPAFTVYTQGCNRKCDHCHNAHLIPFGPAKMIWADVLETIKDRLGWIEGVCFSGGEPTLQPGLLAAMMQIRDLGLPVGLHTNGDYLMPTIASVCEYILLSQYDDNKIYVAKLAKKLSLSKVVKNEAGEWENKITIVK